MKNNWIIKISETDVPMKGFGVSVENNGEAIDSLKGAVRTFDDALAQGKQIVFARLKQIADKRKYATHAKDLFAKTYLMNHKGVDIQGVYGVGTGTDENGDAILIVAMDTTNPYTMKLVPDSIELPKTPFTYKIKKEYGEQAIAGVGKIDELLKDKSFDKGFSNENKIITPNKDIANK